MSGIQAPPGAARRQARRLVAGELRPLAVGLTAASAASLATVGSATLAGRALDAVLRDDRAALHLAAAGAGALVVVKLLGDRWSILLLRRAAERAIARLRVRAFARLQELPLTFFERRGTGALVARLTTDVEQLTRLVNMRLADLVSAVVLVLTALTVLAGSAPLAALPLLAGLPPAALAARWYLARAPRANLEAREQVALTVDMLGEALAAHRLLELSGRAGERAEAWTRASAAARDAEAHARRLDAAPSVGVGAGAALAFGLTVGTGAFLVQESLATPGEVAAVAIVLGALLGAATLVISWTVEIVTAGAAFARVAELIETPSELPEPATPVPLPARGALELDEVTFGYRPDEPLFDGVTLRLEPGRRVALVGPTGSGKSTLATLMGRLRDPAAGAIRFAGVDLRRAALSEVRRRIVVLPQDAHVFRGSMLENVRIARPDATAAEVEAALHAVGALERFAARAGGLDAPVSNAELSEGERQLVGLARVALTDAAVVVLDESTAHVDARLERVIEASLASLSRRRILVVVAHRLTTARRADRVVMLDGGRVVDDGAPADLIAAGGPFARLHEAWEGEEQPGRERKRAPSVMTRAGRSAGNQPRGLGESSRGPRRGHCSAMSAGGGSAAALL